MIKCTNCNIENPEGALFCKNCGTKLVTEADNKGPEDDTIKCEKCNTINPKSSIYCKNCGMSLTDKTVYNNSFTAPENGNKKCNHTLIGLIILGILSIIAICLFINTKKNDNKDIAKVDNIEEPIGNVKEETAPEEHIHEYIVSPISDTMHIIECTKDDCDFYDEKSCDFVDGLCICGNESTTENTTGVLDDTQVFQDKIKGVWGYKDNYFLNFDGNGGYGHGWFESEALPYTHIIGCKELDTNIFEVEFLSEPYIEEDEETNDENTPKPWTAIIDGSYDEFHSIITLKVEGKDDSYFIYLGSNYEEAAKIVYEGGYSEKYESLINNITGGLENVLYDDETICELAREYYKKYHGEEPPLVAIDHKNGNEYAIHLYEIMEYEDSPDENHAATWGWYWIDATTLKGTDFFDMPVDLNEVK